MTIRTTITLVPWELTVSAGLARVDLTINGNQVQIQKHDTTINAPPNGFFALYERDVFGIFEWPGSSAREIGLLIEGRLWRLVPGTHLASTKTASRRSFILNSEHSEIVFEYRKVWWHLLRHPWTAINEVVVADDWWGIVSDLPGWVASTWTSGDLAESLSDCLKQRRAEKWISVLSALKRPRITRGRAPNVWRIGPGDAARKALVDQLTSAYPFRLLWLSDFATDGNNRWMSLSATHRLDDLEEAAYGGWLLFFFEQNPAMPDREPEVPSHPDTNLVELLRQLSAKVLIVSEIDNNEWTLASAE